MSGVARLRLRRGVPLFDQVHAAFFGSGEQGIYMPGVHESFFRGDLFQDAAGTTPVTAAGQSVGLWLDRSGNDNHASQSTAASRPTLQQDANGMYVLRFDGVDDFLVTPSIDFTGTDKMTVITGALNTTDDFTRVLVELSPNLGASIGAFYIALPASPSSTQAQFASKQTTNRISNVGTVLSEPVVLRGIGDIAAPLSQIHVNGGAGSLNDLSQGTGNYRNHPLYIGSRSDSLRFKGDLYGLIICGAQKTLAQIEHAEALVNRYARAY